MADEPPVNPSTDPPTVPDPPANPSPAPPSNRPSDHNLVTRTEFTAFSETVTGAIAGLTEAVTKLVDATPARDQTAVGIPWTHRGSRRDGAT